MGNLNLITTHEALDKQENFHPLSHLIKGASFVITLRRTSHIRDTPKGLVKY
jgi:hypothetical protein